MQEFKIKQGDTAPAIEAQLLGENQQPRDLNGADTVNFHMENISEGTVVVEDTASIEDASEGRVSYSWSAGDTDMSGRHDAEFEVVYSDGDVETFPNSSDIAVYVTEEIA